MQTNLKKTPKEIKQKFLERIKDIGNNYMQSLKDLSKKEDLKKLDSLKDKLNDAYKA